MRSGWPAPEPAADVLREQANFFFVEPQRRSDGFTNAEDVLGRRPHPQAAGLGVGRGRDRAWFHRGAGDARRGQANFRRHGIGPKGGLDVAEGHRLRAGDVVLHVRVHLRRAGCRRRAHVADRRQRIHLGDHRLGRIQGLISAFSGHQREGLADVVDLVAIQDRPSATLHVLRTPVAQTIRGLRQIIGGPDSDDARHR